MITERLLFQFEEVFAFKQNRKPCAIEFAQFPETHADVLSMFVRDSYTIFFNMDKIDVMDETEILGSLIHEGRHAYQWCQVSEPEKAREPKEILTLWQRDFDNYLQPTGEVANAEYAGQALEIDAIAYTAMNVELFEIGNLVIPEEIREAVEKRISEIRANQ